MAGNQQQGWKTRQICKGKKGRGEGKAKGACRVQQVKHRKTKIITLKHTHLLSYLQADDGRSRNTKLQSEPTGSLVSPWVRGGVTGKSKPRECQEQLAAALLRRDKTGKFYRAAIIRVNKNEYTIPRGAVGDTSFSSLNLPMPYWVARCSLG